MTGRPVDTGSSTAWISQGFEQLVDRVRYEPKGVHFDVLIVGSGYGGAIAAATFAGRNESGGGPIKVGVLERGKEYLPGSFPKGLSELPGYVRLDHNKEALFDVRLGPDVNTVVANGVGGGSLINAGVMEVPIPAVFQTNWPSQLRDLSSWESFFDRARDLLGASINGVRNTIEDHEDGVPQKYCAIREIAPSSSFRPAAITIAMRNSISSGNVSLNKCVRCGDCATGCNFGAKNSLDVNLLARAQQQGAEIFSGATVLNVEKDGSTWIANCVYTDAALRARDGEGVKVRANKIVLAAGTLGSSEILLRSRSKGLRLSDALGNRCSTNGDMLIADYATSEIVNTVANETVRPSARAIGPTITGVIDLREKAGVLIEEMSVPAGLNVAFSEIFATVNALHSLASADLSQHSRGLPNDDIYAAPAARISRSAVYAVMADDRAAGSIELVGKMDDSRDGIARIRWAGLNGLGIFDKQVETLAGLTRKSGGRIIPNPAWKLLPTELAWLLRDQRGPLTTVHPLGGCVMGDTGATGVVDHLGRVFSTSNSTSVHDGLVVLDGSSIPTALGTNPALTISAVALRAAEGLAVAWGYRAGSPLAGAPPLDRPVFRYSDVAAQPPETEAEIIERLDGPVSFSSDGIRQIRIVELTLRFTPKRIAELLPSNGGNATLQVASNGSDPALRSRIRIFPRFEWERLDTSWDPPHTKEQKLDAIALFSAPITGNLRIFERQKSCAIGRIWRASKAWLLNRGLRDIYQAIVDGDGGPGLLSWLRIKSGLAVASRSGEIRALVYDLTIGAPDPGAKIALNGAKIVGTKTFTYERRCNPWRQLMEVKLNTFPGLSLNADERILTLDDRYLARIGVPLFRIVRQPNGVSAIAELIGFLGYFVRLLLGLHIWSFRAPDADRERVIANPWPPSHLVRSNGKPVAAQIQDIPISPEKPDLGEGTVNGSVRLTRYPNCKTKKRPVVMFHGYSAAGSTFAHHAVNPNLASHLWETGRDVWIADLRTSFGQPTAKEPWSLDQIGAKDVPAVLKIVAAKSDDRKVDVVAHCMGAVVFSMAVLGGHVKGLVDRVALTQVGPLVVFSPANIFRAYALRYLINFLPHNYSFNPENPTVADDLWDRVVSTLPYPVEEFDVENPRWPWKRTPWTRTRHRMDALYGRAFNAVNMEPQVLRYINDHFGTMSLQTVSTTIQFVRYSLMTNFKGQNDLVSRERFQKYWTFPTFSVHGAKNGLSHVSTVDRMRQILADAGCLYVLPFIHPAAGHQDALIGTGRQATFKMIENFLDTKFQTASTAPQSTLTAYPPWIGPIITEERPKTPALVVRLGSLPSHRTAEGALMLRVMRDNSRILRPDDPMRPWDRAYIIGHMVVYTSDQLRNRWDAFEAPLPSVMPGYDINRPGNALLVLLCYGESPALAAFVRARQLQTSLSVPALIKGHFVADASKQEVFWFDPTGAKPSRVEKNFEFDRFTAMADAALRALQGYIGQDSLGTVLDQDRDLLDGVIEYDPPPKPRKHPDPSGTSLMVASCQYPAGFIDGPLAYRSYDKLRERLDGCNGIKPRFAVFVGDQAYVDPTAGLYDPSSLDDRYRLPYEAWLRQRSVRNTLRRIPSFMLLDDHEIDDNWEPISYPDDPQNASKRQLGWNAYIKYERGMNGGLETFVFDGFPFFMLDTRTERMHRKVRASLATANLFASQTMDRLKRWLVDAPPGPKFVVTPSMLLPRHRIAVQNDPSLDPANLNALHSDSWDGYPTTLREVLAFIAAKEIHNVVFLSGDEHRGCVTVVDLLDSLDKPITRIHSIHTAALYAPFPFANSLDEDIIVSETIMVNHPSLGDYKCLVNASRPRPGDGGTFLSIEKDHLGWVLKYEFTDGKVEALRL